MIYNYSIALAFVNDSSLPVVKFISITKEEYDLLPNKYKIQAENKKVVWIDLK